MTGSTASSASAGGARAAGGVSNQARVTAWASAYLLAGQPLPGEFARVGIPRALGAETALEVDDVAVVSDDAVLLIQAKGGLTLRREPTSDMAKSVGQVVRQFHNGMPTASGFRPLNPSRDLLAIVGDGNSSHAVRALAQVCDRLRTLPATAPIASTARTEAESKGLDCLLLHVRREWEGITGRMPTEAEIRSLTAVLAVKTLDLTEGEPLAAAKMTLAGVLLNAPDVERAWDELVHVGLSLATTQRWLDRNTLVQRMAVDIGPERQLAYDVRQLREVSRATLSALSAHAEISIGGHEISVRRHQIDLLLADDANCVLVGTPGSGKTGVLARLGNELDSAGHDVIALAIDQLGLSAGSARHELGLNFDLAVVIGGWTGAGIGTLILDGLDAVRSEASGWLRSLCRSLKGTRWRVVASMREFDLRHSREWQKVFTGTPLTDTVVDPEFSGVRHVRVGSFSTSELSDLSNQSEDIASLLHNAPDGLLELLSVPFNLSVATDLLGSGQSQHSLSSLTSEIDLLNRFWQVRITDARDGVGRRQVARRVTRAMLDSRRLTLDSDTLSDAPLAAREALLHDGVLEEFSGRLRLGGRTRIGFAHHTLFDFAVAALVLTENDQSRLVSELDLDPNLVFVARPSIDFHLTELWHATSDRVLFLEVVLQLANSDHVLAGIAAGKTILTGFSQHEDLEYLITWVQRTSDSSRIATIIGWAVGAMEAAGAAELDQVRSRISVWTRIVGRLTEFLLTRYDGALAYQIARLQLRLDAVLELGVGPSEVDKERADAVARLVSIAAAEPATEGGLVGNLARLLPKAVAVEPLHAKVVHELINPAVIEVLPSRIYAQLVDQVATLAQGNPDVATEMLIALWEFTPDADDVTTLVSGVVGLTSTKRQDANHVKWQVGEEFAKFISVAGVVRASRVVAAVGALARENEFSRYSYPITFKDSVGLVQQAFGLMPHEPGMRAAEKILDAFIAALPGTSPEDMSATLTILAQSVSHPAVWRAILAVGAQNPEGLGDTMLPVLEAGGLLANPETRRAAVELAAACASRSECAWTELERALVRAAAILANNTEAVDRLLDQVIAEIPPASISDPDFRVRRTTLNEVGAPRIPEPLDGLEAEWEPVSTGVAENCFGGLGPAQQDLAHRLKSELESFRASSDVPNSGPLLAALMASIESMPLPSKDSDPFWDCMIDSCEALAERSALLPGDPVGTAAVELLLKASKDDDGGRA